VDYIRAALFDALFIVHTGFASKPDFKVDGMTELKHKVMTTSKGSDEMAGIVADTSHQYGGVESCAVKCNAYSGCTAWQYESSSASCALFTGTPTFIAAAGYTSGALSTSGRPASFQTVVNIDDCECEWSDPDSKQWCENADSDGCVQGATGSGEFNAQKFCYCKPWSSAPVFGTASRSKCDQDGTCVQTRSSTCIVNQLAEDDNGIASKKIKAYNGIKCPSTSTKFASVCKDAHTDSGMNFCDCGRRLTSGLGANAGAETCGGAEMCAARGLLISAGGEATAPEGCTGQIATTRVLTKSCAESPRPKDYNLGCCTNVDETCDAWAWQPEACSCGDNIETRDVCFKLEAPTATDNAAEFTCSTTAGAVTGFNWICAGDAEAGTGTTPRLGEANPMQTTMSDANAEYVTVQGEVEPVQKPNWAVYNFVVGSGSGELGEKNTQSCKYEQSCDCDGDSCTKSWTSQDLFGTGGSPACIGTARTVENMEVTPREGDDCPKKPGCCTSMWSVATDWGAATGCGVCEQTRTIGCVHECLPKVGDSVCACLQKPPTRRLIGCYNDCKYKWHVQKRSSCLGRDFKCASATQAGCHFHPIPDGTIQRWSRASVRTGTITDEPGHPSTALPNTDDIIWDPRHPHCWWSVASDFHYSGDDSMGYTAYEDASSAAKLPDDENLVADAEQIKKFFYYADSGSTVLKLDLSKSQYGGAITSSSLPEDGGVSVDTTNIEPCSATVNPCASGKAPETGMFSVNPSKGYVWTPSDNGELVDAANGMIRYGADQEVTYTFAIRAVHGLKEDTGLLAYVIGDAATLPAVGLAESTDDVAGPQLEVVQGDGDGKAKVEAQLTYGKWAHVAVVVTTSKVELYLDGQVAGSKAYDSGEAAKGGQGQLFCGPSATSALSGNVEMYGLHVYMKALTGAEITKDMTRGQALVAGGNGDLESTDTGSLSGNSPVATGAEIEGFSGTSDKVWAIYERSSLNYPASGEGNTKSLGLQGGGSYVRATVGKVEPGLRYVVAFRTATPSTRYLGCYKDVLASWESKGGEVVTCDARSDEAEAAWRDVQVSDSGSSKQALVASCLSVTSSASGNPRFFAPLGETLGCAINADAPPTMARVSSGNCDISCGGELCGGEDLCGAVSFYEISNAAVSSLTVTLSNFNGKAMEGESKADHLAKCPNNFCPMFSFDAMDAPGVWSTRVASYVSMYKGKTKLQFSIESTAGDNAFVLIDDVTMFNVQGAFIESTGVTCSYASGTATVHTRVDAGYAPAPAEPVVDGDDCTATTQCAGSLVCFAESGTCGVYDSSNCREGIGSVSACKYHSGVFAGYTSDGSNVMPAAANSVLPQWYCAALCQSTYACAAFDTSVDKTSCTIYTNADASGDAAASGSIGQGASCFMRA
jgi:hypothetical protein